MARPKSDSKRPKMGTIKKKTTAPRGGRTISINNQELLRFCSELSRQGMRLLDTAPDVEMNSGERAKVFTLRLSDQFDKVAEVKQLPGYQKVVGLCEKFGATADIKQVPRTQWHDTADMIALVITKAVPSA